ncbi:MAG: tyrosine-type recombinase/integrase [Pseudomonadota bacterium]
MGLTEKRVRDAKASEKTRFEWDDHVRGLGLRITHGGAKSFVLNYRVGGAERRLTIGRAKEMSLAEARRRAIEVKEAACRGRDLLAETRQREAEPTVSNALDRFLTEYVPRRRQLGLMAESTARKYSLQIERHLRPALGKKRVRDVVQADVERMLRSAPEDTRKRGNKNPKGEPIPPIQANRVRALTMKFFRKCEDWGLREQGTNPARGVEKAREEARDRTLSAEELAALGQALANLEANPGGVLAIRLAALTGLRIGEIRSMRWDDVDMQSGALVLPKTKTGRRKHTLPTAALLLLSKAPRIGECVVPGRDPNTPLDDRAIRRVFEKACDVAGISGATVHDLRRTVMTQAAALGVSAHLLRDMVGHKTTAMADRYIRNAGEPLTELRERMGAGMAAMMGGAEPAAVAEIGKGRRRG